MFSKQKYLRLRMDKLKKSTLKSGQQKQLWMHPFRAWFIPGICFIFCYSNRYFVVHCVITSLLFSVSYQTAHIIWSSSLPIKNIGSTRTGVPYDPKFLTSNLNSFRMTIQCITLPIILYKISHPFGIFLVLS